MSIYGLYKYFSLVKIFTAILAIYVLSLSFVTCNDEVPHDIVMSDVVSIVADVDHHSDGEAVDYCSPFCSCQCCQLNMNIQDIEGFDLIQPKISTKLFSNSYSVAQEFTYSKFEPPKV